MSVYFVAPYVLWPTCQVINLLKLKLICEQVKTKEQQVQYPLKKLTVYFVYCPQQMCWRSDISVHLHFYFNFTFAD